jgi:chromosome segregation ATPase
MRLKVMMIAGMIALSSYPVLAQGTDYKAEMTGDKAALRAGKDEMKEDASAAKQEEKQLRDQIRAAEQSGDMAAAQQLREQLKAVHQANVEEKKQDRQAMGAAKQELRQDKKEARIDRLDTNNDGTVDRAERAQYGRRYGNRDNDSNPPGPAGGRGTNWENPPGPQGGPGASPDKRVGGNPPGPRGGPGRGVRK